MYKLSWPSFLVVQAFLSSYSVLVIADLPSLFLSQLFCPCKSWPALSVLSRETCHADLSKQSCPGFPVQDVLSWLQSCSPNCPVHASHVLAFLSSLSCPGCPVLTILSLSLLSCVSCSDHSSPLSPVMHVLSLLPGQGSPFSLSCPCYHVLTIQSWWSCLVALSWLSFPGCPVPAILLLLSYLGCPRLSIYGCPECKLTS